MLFSHGLPILKVKNDNDGVNYSKKILAKKLDAYFIILFGLINFYHKYYQIIYGQQP